jgi:hypothetical protein
MVRDHFEDKIKLNLSIFLSRCIEAFLGGWIIEIMRGQGLKYLGI